MEAAVLRVAELKLDSHNPRLPDQHFKTDLEAIEHLVQLADLTELVQSIGNSGWLNFEPPIVEESTKVVLEGNRRLAALRLLSDPELASSIGVKLPEKMHENARPERILVNLVTDRRAARDFIGFKHVNGAQKWDSYAKARFATDWYMEGEDIDAVSRRLGDNHNTVSRLINGIQVLDQAETTGRFDRNKITKSRFFFSHLYTALPNASVRDFLGLDENDNSVIPPSPVPNDHLDELGEFLTWIYGQDDVDAVVQTQNPDLSRLVKVLASERGVRQLRATMNLDRAFDEVDDKAKRFRTAFYTMQDAVEHVSGLVSRYDPTDELLDDALNTQFTLRGIVQQMKGIHSRNDDTE